MSNSPKSLLAGLAIFAIKAWLSVIAVIIYPKPAVLLAVFVFWTWQLAAPYRRDLAELKASLKRGEAVNPLWLRLTNIGPKLAFSVMASVVYPMLGIPAVAIFWLVDLTFLSRRKAAARASAPPTYADKAGVASGDTNGAEWGYSCSRFDLTINFERDEARLISHVDNVEAVKFHSPSESRFDQNFRLSDLACAVDERNATIHFFVFTQEIVVVGPPINVKWRGDELVREGSAHLERNWHSTPDFGACFREIGPVLASDFHRYWMPIEKRIFSMGSARAGAYLTEQQDSLAAMMLNKRAAWKAEREISVARAEEVKKLAGLVDPLSETALFENGSLAWTMSADKSGQAAIQLGNDLWIGSLKEACAKATLDEIPAKTDGTAPTFALGIVIKDDEFERSQLRKRRFQLMVGYSKAQITTWIDRIEILAR
ncbi:hypothetical protein [Janthinobacterium sp. PSPC3-1]|uniref:hypothetical protein n=1 Tax=Janthinobacterium sp. PSPC3-1 TaxID=2804653 RepID=UPI003CE7C38F